MHTYIYLEHKYTKTYVTFMYNVTYPYYAQSTMKFFNSTPCFKHRTHKHRD